MRFGRRRSGLAADSFQTEPETRRRNRLSKPLTSNATKIQTSTSALALSLQVPTQSKNASTTELPASPLSAISGTVLRQHIRNDILAQEDDSHSPTRTVKNDSSWRVAYMVSRLEGKKPTAETPQKQAQQQPLEPAPLSPVKPQKRKSILLRRLSLQRQSSLSRTPSYERVNSLKSETAVTNTPTPSLDQIVESPSIPPTRRASFAPGTATRRTSPIKAKQDIQVHKFQELEDTAARVVDSDYLDWQPPPPRTVGRAGTPSDMGYLQLGGLRHGSLQIVNGRASPAFSEASKVSRQLLTNHTPPHRDVSSEYGDADEEVEQTDLPSIHGDRNGPVERRIFSWEKDDDEVIPRSHPLQTVMNPEEDTTTGNHTSLMANEYIAELPASPFEQQRQSSPVDSIRRARSDSSLFWRPSSRSSLQRSPSVEKGSSELSPSSPLQLSVSPTGSVIRKTSFETAGRRLLQMTPDHKHHTSDSTMSWHSPMEAIDPADEAFQSAVEFQVQLSPTRNGLKPFRAPEKSDSGYSSSNSLRSFHAAKRTTPPPVEMEAFPQVSNSTTGGATPQSARPASFLVNRPSILKLRRTELNVPTLANMRSSVVSAEPAVASMATAVPGTANDEAKPGKARKKLLKKRRPVSQSPGQISLVKVQSFEVESIPQVSPAARENLRVRSQTVPELERTYMPPDIMENTPNRSLLDLSNTAFRFPSPGPVQSLQVKRSRSRSRPRTWFERSKTDITDSRGDSGISRAEANAIIDRYGTDSAGLGRSPYDLSSHGALSQKSGTVPIISTALPPQPRSMMDDRTAAELSRGRSRSLREREYTVPGRRLSFNDRGGIPGKNLSPAGFSSEAPPITSEMLEKAYRTSSMQRQPSWSTDLAPPPPPHASRPSYLNYEEVECDAVAPPPPPHSPQPVDITADPWVARAAAWKARRKSAGEALRRQAWDYQEYEGYHESSDNELLYPVIPPGQQSERAQYLSPKKFSSSPQEYHRGNMGPSRHQQVYRSPYEADDHEPTYARPYGEYPIPHDTRYPYMNQSREASRHRPLPQPRPANGAVTPRPHSRANSARSFASSIAEELHPRHLDRQHPPPAFGRYSGGMAFGYEHGSGFGGSAGTRSSSGQAGASRKGVYLTASHGVDLGDVPVGIMARQ
ncbi:hypothetical protein A1O7_01230 [Cladophialophora yegresii CBS 114405]|uniref:Uncharacterized protein n=1 Tax=Cladophialophora yegresii CBS 114405 TaxID=1182544 RepID=W9WJW9_9EURO|nr:uncharacterized protein A1O7_01230 [Cladophialophora yegresii CBS 114405]EXJ64891.1 hypothetical protein A1O7_01230 [Cladophialophora yegresii CBS 114405]